MNERKAIQLVRSDLEFQLTRIEDYIDRPKNRYAKPDSSLLTQICYRMRVFVQNLVQHDFNFADDDDDDDEL